MKNKYELLGTEEFYKNLANAIRLTDFFKTFGTDKEISGCLQFYLATQIIVGESVGQDTDKFFETLKSNCIILAENFRYFAPYEKGGTEND